jgi:hypothetical protein
MKHFLTGFAVIAIFSAAGSALAADLLLRAVAPVHAARWAASGQQELVPRPPRPVVETFEPTDRRPVAAAAEPNTREAHVLEFLRWKAQLR